MPDVEAAVDALLAQHHARRDMAPLPDGLRPATLDDALAVQDALTARRASAGRVQGGWKIALTTPVMQAMVGIDHPCRGAMFTDTMHTSPCTLRAADYVRLGVESEIAVRLGADVPPAATPWARETIGAFVAEAMAAIEIVDDRNWDYDTADVRDLVADNAFNFGCVLGAPRTDWQTLDLGALVGRMRVNSEIAGEGRGADVLGHPLEALAWLANHLAERGLGLRAGEVVMTGSVVTTRWPEAGATVVTEIDGFAPAELRIA